MIKEKWRGAGSFLGLEWEGQKNFVYWHWTVRYFGLEGNLQAGNSRSKVSIWKDQR